MKLDVESVLTGLRHARHETILAWSPELDSEVAPHLLNALLDVELAIVQIEKAEDAAPSEITEMAHDLSGGRPQ